MYDLPKHPADLIPTFEDLCRTFPPDSIPELRKGLDATLEHLSRLQDAYLGPHLETAQAIAERLYLLIDKHQSYPSEKLPLIVGAIRYFIIGEDSVPDHKPIVGFDDDVKVLNYVLDQLGLTDLCL